MLQTLRGAANIIYWWIPCVWNCERGR